MTVVLGAFLTVLGVAAYGWGIANPPASVTALIPTFIGLPILLLGVWAKRSPARLALATHIAIVLALIGLVGSARGLLSLPALLTRSDELARPAAVLVQSLMAVACLVYMVFAVRSFIAARRGKG